MKIFRCLAFASTLISNRHKFDIRVSRCVFLSYPFDMKRYKLMDMEKERVFVSRSVVFNDNVMSCRSKMSEDKNLEYINP